MQQVINMKVQYASDLHLEFRANREWLRENPLEVTGDVLLLAGDIMHIEDIDLFWCWARDNYKQVLAVPGNHEFYGADILNYGESFVKPIYENVAYYYNKVVRIEDTDFVLSTLWSDITSNEKCIESGLNDFWNIRYGSVRYRPKYYNQEYKSCLNFIKQAVKESTAKHIVVCTHHAPSLLTIATEHLTSPLRYAFASDLDYLMEDGRIDYWLYGHSHTNINCKVFKTEVVCNQLGYVEHNGQMAGFRLDKNFEV